MKFLFLYVLDNLFFFLQVLFENKRLPFLDKMPPFAADLSKRLVSLQEGVVATTLENMKPVKNVDTSNDSLFKLQVGLV